MHLIKQCFFSMDVCKVVSLAVVSIYCVIYYNSIFLSFCLHNWHSMVYLYSQRHQFYCMYRDSYSPAFCRFSQSVYIYLSNSREKLSTHKQYFLFDNVPLFFHSWEIGKKKKNTKDLWWNFFLNVTRSKSCWKGAPRDDWIPFKSPQK